MTITRIRLDLDWQTWKPLTPYPKGVSSRSSIPNKYYRHRVEFESYRLAGRNNIKACPLNIKKDPWRY